MILEGTVKSANRETKRGEKNGKPWEFEDCHLLVSENQSMESLDAAVEVSIEKSQRTKISDIQQFVGQKVKIAVTSIEGAYKGIGRVSGRILSGFPQQVLAGKPA